jgi:predicted Zn-dependent peptidase
MELLSDMVFHHQFTERSLASEREVILDEINSCKDNPSDLIFDEFDQGVFPGHPWDIPSWAHAIPCER